MKIRRAWSLDVPLGALAVASAVAAGVGIVFGLSSGAKRFAARADRPLRQES